MKGGDVGFVVVDASGSDWCWCQCMSQLAEVVLALELKTNVKFILHFAAFSPVVHIGQPPCSLRQAHTRAR